MSQDLDPTAACKLKSLAWSTGTLECGQQAIAAQQVKEEDDLEVMRLQAELEDMQGLHVQSPTKVSNSFALQFHKFF